MKGLGFRIQGYGFRSQGSELGVKGSGFRAKGLRVKGPIVENHMKKERGS